MKCLTLLQPWATLVATGAKKIETRTWETKYRGQMAIHASKKFTRNLQDLSLSYPFCGPLFGDVEMVIHKTGRDLIRMLPLGAVIATCDLVDVLYIGKNHLHEYRDGLPRDRKMPMPTGQELAFGDYSQGRYAWLLEDVRMLSKPILAKGRLGLWEWEEGGQAPE